MRTYTVYLIVVFCALSTIGTKGQSLSTNSLTTATPSEYYLQVKQFGEFIDRFNYISDWKGNRIDSSFAAKYPRPMYMNYLLNQNDNRLTNPNDTAYKTLCKQFINEMCDAANSQYISLYSEQVTAKALVNINYLGKNQSAIVNFTPEVLTDRSAKWVISDVQTNCFNSVSDSLLTYFISPNSHETNFINLKRIEHLSNPLYFLPNNLATNNILLFITEVAAGRLTINYTEKLSYQITLNKWQITVEEFSRSAYNSGWLISNVKGLE